MGAPGGPLRGPEGGPGAPWVSHEGAFITAPHQAPKELNKERGARHTRGTRASRIIASSRTFPPPPRTSPDVVSYFTFLSLLFISLLLPSLFLLDLPTLSILVPTPLVQPRGPPVCSSGFKSRDGHKSVWYLAAWPLPWVTSWVTSCATFAASLRHGLLALAHSLPRGGHSLL